MRVAAYGVLLALASAASLRAEPSTLRLDPDATAIRFEVGATLHTVRGEFGLSRGELRFDLETGAIEGDVVVDARSGDTGIDRRDRVMHQDLLATDRHPEIVLRARRLEDLRSDGDRVEGVLHGELVLRGEAHPLRLPFSGRRDGERAVVEARFEVPYVAWGLPDPDTMLLKVDDVVQAEVRAEGTLDAPAP